MSATNQETTRETLRDEIHAALDETLKMRCLYGPPALVVDPEVPPRRLEAGAASFTTIRPAGADSVVPDPLFLDSLPPELGGGKLPMLPLQELSNTLELETGARLFAAGGLLADLAMGAKSDRPVDLHLVDPDAPDTPREQLREKVFRAVELVGELIGRVEGHAVQVSTGFQFTSFEVGADSGTAPEYTVRVSHTVCASVGNLVARFSCGADAFAADGAGGLFESPLGRLARVRRAVFPLRIYVQDAGLYKFSLVRDIGSLNHGEIARFLECFEAGLDLLVERAALPSDIDAFRIWRSAHGPGPDGNGSVFCGRLAEGFAFNSENGSCTKGDGGELLIVDSLEGPPSGDDWDDYPREMAIISSAKGGRINHMLSPLSFPFPNGDWAEYCEALGAGSVPPAAYKEFKGRVRCSLFSTMENQELPKRLRSEASLAALRAYGDIGEIQTKTDGARKLPKHQPIRARAALVC